MTRIRFITSAIVVLLIGIAFWWFTRTGPEAVKQPVPQPPVQKESEEKESRVEDDPIFKKYPPGSIVPYTKKDPKWEWKRPIDFYGKVVDEKDQPVPGAEIEFGWTDLSDDGHSERRTTSDGQGLFSLNGVNGKHLGIHITKEGYYTSFQRNRFDFEYADPAETHYHKPDPSNPVLFRLVKKREPAELVRRDKDYGVPKDGTPIQIDIRKGKKIPAGQGDLQIECWTEDQRKDGMNRYNWRCRISVPGGGLVQTTKEFDVEAPENGYKPADEILMTTDLGKDWKDNVRKKYFLKLRDGNFARIDFKMFPFGDHFCSIESYLNPTGSRNLEYDPAKEIKSAN